ncbi:hypothetical protein WT74_31125 [Burkholderia stagnalis]|nr:hypothetical protein WT74_31125 [Burkholderia stagnalis]
MLGNEHACGDVVARQNRLRQPLDQYVNALFAGALPCVVVQPFAGEGEAIHQESGRALGFRCIG